MTEATKRRGRPPKETAPTAIIPLPKGATRDEVEAMREAIQTGLDAMAPTRRVFVRWKVAMGQPGEERELDWPDTWSIPQPGDQVTWAEKVSGIVSHILYDLPNGRIVIQVR